MATRDIVPRADSEGSIGTTLKRWLGAWFDAINGKDISSGVATTAEVDSLSAIYAPLAGGTMAGDLNNADYKVIRPYLQDWAEVVNALGSITTATTINLETANVVTATIGAALTFTFSNPPATDRAGGFVLHLTNGGAYTVTWPTSVDWPSGTAPTLTAAGVDVLTFQTLDAGTTWRGVLSAKDVK